MAPGLQHFAERLGDGQPRVDDDGGEELMHVEPGVTVVLGARPPEASGTLYITTKRVVWLSDTDQAKGYAVDFLSLSLHAVSTDPEAYPSPCIYTQIETEMEDGEELEGSDSECSGVLELSRITEMRLVPSNPSQLDTLFDIFCECAELNPDPNGDEEEENEWFFGDEAMADNGEHSEGHVLENLANPIGYANGDDDIARTVLELQINDQRFEDAEEVENNSHGGQK